MKFKPGQSGNPAGRPKGVRDKRNRLLTEVLSKDEQSIAEKLAEMAKDGNLNAISIAADFLWTKNKPTADPVSLPELSGKNVSDQGKAIIEAMARGDITLEEANTAMSVVASQARVVEMDEVVRRLEALEKKP